jgi:hypothetical protein
LPKQSDIYELVERAAERSDRLMLWQKTARALIERELPAVNLSDCPAPRSAPKMDLGGWLSQFSAALNRGGSDPSSFKHILKLIIVRVADFEKWLRDNGPRGPRGPQPFTTRLEAADRRLFADITRLIRKGQARSAYGAALQIAKQIAGSGTEDSKARRLSKLYRREREAKH